MVKPSPIRINVPEAHPPAITMPIPNMKAPAIVAKLTGTTYPWPGIGSPLDAKANLMAANPTVATAKAMSTERLKDVPPVR